MAPRTASPSPTRVAVPRSCRRPVRSQSPRSRSGGPASRSPDDPASTSTSLRLRRYVRSRSRTLSPSLAELADRRLSRVTGRLPPAHSSSPKSPGELLVGDGPRPPLGTPAPPRRPFSFRRPGRTDGTRTGVVPSPVLRWSPDLLRDWTSPLRPRLRSSVGSDGRQGPLRTLRGGGEPQARRPRGCRGLPVVHRF